MAFTSDPHVTVAPRGREVRIAWTSSAPAGTIFQVYLDRALWWHGTDRYLDVPWPRSRVRIDVGHVGAGEGGSDFSGSLPSDPEPSDRVQLTWQGGAWQGDVAGYAIYQSATAGGSVSYTTRVGYVPATTAGVDLSGFGQGGFGDGGWGQAAVSYAWTSARLGSGVWSFAVVPVDPAGNAQGSPTTTTATVVAAPNPPAPNAAGVRLTYTYNAGTRVPTLIWQASPP